MVDAGGLAISCHKNEVSESRRTNFSGGPRSLEEEVGLSIYAEFALERFVNSAIHVKQDPQDHDILFICLENAVVNEEAFILAVKEFQRGVGISEIEARMRRAPDVSRDTYTGAHSTQTDPSLRRRLRDIARRIDADLLDGKFTRREPFRCSKKT